MNVCFYNQTLERVKQAREEQGFQLVVTHLRKQELPNKEDLTSWENVQFSLLCLNQEMWNNVYRESMINKKHSTGLKAFDEIEKALEEGHNFNELLSSIK